MSTFAIFSIAIAIVVFDITNIKAVKDFDIENVLKHLGQLHKKDFLFHRTPEYPTRERDKNTGEEFLDLIQNIARSPQLEMGSVYKENDFIVKEKDRRNKYGRYQYWPWRQYLYVKPPWLKSINTPRKLNYALSDYKKHDDANSDFGDYSRIYVLLDSRADISEVDVRDISNMVSSMLSKPNARRKPAFKDHIQKIRRYKGFVLRDNRRRMRDSKETKDSKEHDYKPKRPRGNYGRGGGRTAIPYIGHRGDIFEKE